MSKREVKATKLTVGLPFNLGQLEFEPDVTERQAAWELYVELATRVSIQPMEHGVGFVREALSSLHKIINVSRSILREAGPSIARGRNSLGAVAIEVISKGIRPFLSKWHPLLFEYEHERPEDIDALEHERSWEKAPEFFAELTKLQEQMQIYVEALAQISGAKFES